MVEGYKRHIPRRVAGIRPLAAPAGRPRPAEAIARGGARRAGRDDAGGARREVGGPSGPEPTRYGDWERGGRCVDF